MLVRAFPPGAGADPELALVRAGSDLVQGHLDEAAAHLAVAETLRRDGTARSPAPPPRGDRSAEAVAGPAPRSPGRRRRAGQIPCLPVTGQSDEDIALGSDLRAVALMNLGTVEAWSLGLPEAERHLQEGAALAREIGRPYLEVSCLAQLGFASKIHSLAMAQRRCREAIALAERHGWGTEPVIVPALLTLAGTMVWTGEFDEAERWLQRAARALETDAGPGIRLLLHLMTGMLQAGAAATTKRSRVRRGQTLAISAGGLARSGQPDERLDAGHAGPSRDGRRGSCRAGGAG